MAKYYQGLKNPVKDEISQSDKPETLLEMIQLAIKIDNRIYKRRLEKKGVYSYNYCIGGKTTTKYHSPIELDATHSFKSKKPSKEVIEERRKKGLCFECGLLGY